MIEMVVLRFKDVYLLKSVFGLCLVNDVQSNCDLSFDRMFR